MTSTRELVVAAGLFGLAVLAAGLTTHGVRVTAPKGDGATPSGSRAAVHEELERLEGAVPAGRNEDHWRAYLEVFETERAQGHLAGAIRVLYDAYAAALESHQWESVIAVGDAFMAIGRAPGSAAGARRNARQAYLTALIRARRERSVEGALRTATAFEDPADRDAVAQSL